MAIDKKDIISMATNDIPKDELTHLLNSVYNTLLSNKGRSLTYFVVYEEGDTVIDIPEDFNQRLKLIDVLMKYFEKSEEYEKCQELLLFKNLAKRQWGIK